MIYQLDLFERRRNSKPTQADKIFTYLLATGSITQAEAIEKFRCYRLAARIAELRVPGRLPPGYRIVTETEPHQGGSHGRYVLRRSLYGGDR